MRLKNYLKDKILSIIIYFLATILIISILLAFKMSIYLVLIISTILLVTGISILLFRVFSKEKLYSKLNN